MKRIKMARIAALLGLATLALLSVACEQKSINEIMANPHRYTKHEVGVVGSRSKLFCARSRCLSN